MDIQKEVYELIRRLSDISNNLFLFKELDFLQKKAQEIQKINFICISPDFIRQTNELKSGE